MLNATNKKQFIAAAAEVVSFIGKIDEFKGIVKEIHGMPTDNLSLIHISEPTRH